jgi:hypothetical protein
MRYSYYARQNWDDGEYMVDFYVGDELIHTFKHKDRNKCRAFLEKAGLPKGYRIDWRSQTGSIDSPNPYFWPGEIKTL